MKNMAMLCAALVFLASCSRSSGEMDAHLDAIRVLIKQSALMAADAACGGPERDALLRAAAAMNRRAMGGPEMAAIHNMMGMQPDAAGGMDMKADMKKDAMGGGMQRHAALHDAGEAVFDLLEAIGEGKANCAGARAARLAADAALLREAGGGEPAKHAAQLAKAVENAARAAPGAVRALAAALSRI